eukprot:scaffold224238_cov55-Attheya_sp.AAC.3
MQRTISIKYAAPKICQRTLLKKPQFRTVIYELQHSLTPDRRFLILYTHPSPTTEQARMDDDDVRFVASDDASHVHVPQTGGDN